MFVFILDFPRFNLEGDIAATWSCPKWGGNKGLSYILHIYNMSFIENGCPATFEARLEKVPEDELPIDDPLTSLLAKK